MSSRGQCGRLEEAQAIFEAGWRRGRKEGGGEQRREGGGMKVATEPLLRRRKRRESMGSNDSVSLLWLRPSRVRGVSWNVRDAGWDRMLTGCGEEEEEEDWPCWAKG